MKIALVGYGKMGQIIDKIAQTRGHEIVARLNESPTLENLNNSDVVIEFSSPESAFGNIKFCLEQGIPVDIISNSDFEKWKLDETLGKELGIKAVREEEVPGTHIVTYHSEVDEIEIKHTAFNRNGFALGAVIASEWIIGRKGNFTIKEVLGL